MFVSHRGITEMRRYWKYAVAEDDPDRYCISNVVTPGVKPVSRTGRPNWGAEFVPMIPPIALLSAAAMVFAPDAAQLAYE